MFAPLPRPAVWLGLSGLIPFVATVALAAATGDPALRAWALFALAAYGAAILSFLGAVHWGLALATPADAPGAAALVPRLGLGVLPSLAAWVALLLPLGWGLGLLGLAIVITALVESGAAARDLLPKGYPGLRWVLSLCAAVCLFAGAAMA